MRCPPIWCVKMMFDMFDGSLVVKLLFVWSEASSFITLTSLNVTYQQVLECSWYRKDFGESISHQGNPSCRFFVSCFLPTGDLKIRRRLVDWRSWRQKGQLRPGVRWFWAAANGGIPLHICIYIYMYMYIYISTQFYIYLPQTIVFALLSRGPHLLGMLQAFLMARYFLECTTISKT